MTLDRRNVLVVTLGVVIVVLTLAIGAFWEVHRSDIEHTSRYNHAVEVCRTAPDVALCVVKVHP